MFTLHQRAQFSAYKEAREYFANNLNLLVELEKHLTQTLVDLITAEKQNIKTDYDEASYLFPFWQNYPPLARGRSPIGDQYPWIEVGEQTVAKHLNYQIKKVFPQWRHPGIPSGSDGRVLIAGKDIERILKGKTQSAWLFYDVKSVGPRDEAEHAVMSHTQVSGAGVWNAHHDGIQNPLMTAKGKRREHAFYPNLPPIYVLSDGTVAPVLTTVVKPVYSMPSINDDSEIETGQPLKKIVVASIPNGLLLDSLYLPQHPGLLFPGKDDKKKEKNHPHKMRARICFETLRQIASWRVQTILF